MPGTGFWKSKPPLGVALDPSHPLGHGLQALWLFSEQEQARSSPYAERLSGKFATYGSGNGGNPWFHLTPFGAAFAANSSGETVSNGVDVARGRDRLTVHARIYNDGGNEQTVLGPDNSGAGGFQFRFSGNALQVLRRGQSLRATDTFTLATGRWYWVGFTYDGLNGQFYVDGSPTSAYSGVETWLSAHPAFTPGGAAGEYVRDGNRLAECWVWGYPLAPDMMRQHAADPYAPFAPPVWRRYFVAPAGGGASEAAAGISAGTSTVSGTLTATVPIAGAAAGAATASGALVATVPVSAASAGVATAAGTISAAVPVAAASAGASTVAGAITVTSALVGASAGTSTVAGTLSATVPVSSASAGVAAVSGALVATVPVAGASAGVSSVVGALTKESAGSEALVGATDGASTISGTLSAAVPVSASAAGTSTASGTLSAAVAVASAVAGTSTVAGAVVIAAAVAGSSAGISTVAGAIAIGAALVASAAGSSSVSGTLTGGEDVLAAIRAAASDAAYVGAVASDAAYVGAVASDTEGG